MSRSRYTELMSKEQSTLTPKEKIELAKLILEEYEREERRINKLPVDRRTKQECLWNVINAHRAYMDYVHEFWTKSSQKLTLEQRKCYVRMKKEEFALHSYEYQNEIDNQVKIAEKTEADNKIKVNDDKKSVDDKKADNDTASENTEFKDISERERVQSILKAKENMNRRRQVVDNIVDFKKKYRGILENKENEKIDYGTVKKSLEDLSLEKSEYKYSVAGDKTITDAQRKALYQFHHWMRKHNGTAGLKWAGFGYKGSTVDFSERFMRLPARVQLKALYLVESDRRKNPIEDIDNEISQDYVPNYDELKGKMTSSFFFARKYLNKSRYLWSKLEQAANIANNDKSVEKLKSYTDAKLNNENKPIHGFFRSDDSEDFVLKKLARDRDQLRIDLHNENLDEATKAKKKKDLKEIKATLKDTERLIAYFNEITNMQERYPYENTEMSRSDKKKLKKYLSNIYTIKKKYQKNDGWLKKYKHYFWKQTNDLAGYTSTSVSLGTNLYNLFTSKDAHPHINASAAFATLPSAFANVLNDIRAIKHGEGKWDTTFAVGNLLADSGWMVNKGINSYKLVGELSDDVSKAAKGLATAAFGVGFAINTVKMIKSGSESWTASGLNNSFAVLRNKLDEEIKALQDNENRNDKENAKLAKLTDVKKSAGWRTLEKASKLIARDKLREANANIRRFCGSAIGLASNVLGYWSSLGLQYSISSACGGPISMGIGVYNDIRDNVIARNRNREYIDAEYPINDSERIAAIMNYEEQLVNCEKDSDEYKEITDILSSREKLDNRIRNLKAGKHIRANQEGLRNEIYDGYKNTIGDAARDYQEEMDRQAGKVGSEDYIAPIGDRYIENDQINIDINTDINTNVNTDINTNINQNINTNSDNRLSEIDYKEEFDYAAEAGKLLVKYSDLLNPNKSGDKKSDKKDNKQNGGLSIESNPTSMSSESSSKSQSVDSRSSISSERTSLKGKK